MKKDTMITLLTYAAAFIGGDIICNFLGLNSGGIISINFLLSIVILTLCVLSLQLLVSKVRAFLGKR